MEEKEPKGDEAQDFGTFNQLMKDLEATFGDMNKKAKAQQKLLKCSQRGRSTEDFFMEFDQHRRTAGYTSDHNEFLIQLLNDNVDEQIILNIYNSRTIPDDYLAWRKRIIDMDHLHRRLKDLQKTRHSGQPHRQDSQPR